MYLLDSYACSTFNKCPHEPLPMMKCAPIRIHVKEDAKPVACKTASTVPLHLWEAVQRQLDEDVTLGMLEKVPIGTPTTWLARMHVVTKPDGTPRRTVPVAEDKIPVTRRAGEAICQSQGGNRG